MYCWFLSNSQARYMWSNFLTAGEVKVAMLLVVRSPCAVPNYFLFYFFRNSALISSFFKHFDCWDDICLFSHWVGPWPNGSELGTRSNHGLTEDKQNKNQSSEVLTVHRTLLICINGENIESFKQFIHLSRKRSFCQSRHRTLCCSTNQQR